MSQPGTFERVYAAIKLRLRGGDFRPGDRLEPALLSQELNSSVTPVRDALHRLTGERLVEAPRHDGFRTPMLTETMLRHLYAWHLDILLLATTRRAIEAGSYSGLVQTDPLDERLNALFADLVGASGNAEHAAALRNVTERLAPFQRFERDFLDAVDEEIEHIISALRAQDQRALRGSLARYHRRRQRIVPDLLARLHDPE